MGILSLASYGVFGGGSFGRLLSQWHSMGVFDYILPFLLIFAIVFGILSKVNLFGSKGDDKGKSGKTINAVIALAVGLMSLQFDFVSRFFADLMPRLAMGLGVILVILVLGGLFIPSNNKGFNWALIGAVVLVIGVVLYTSFQAYGGLFGGGSWFSHNWGTILSLGIFIALIVAVVAGGSSKQAKEEGPKSILTDALTTEGG